MTIFNLVSFKITKNISQLFDIFSVVEKNELIVKLRAEKISKDCICHKVILNHVFLS